MLAYLHSTFPQRFLYDTQPLNFNEESYLLLRRFAAPGSARVREVFCAAGLAALPLRKHLGLMTGKPIQNKGPGIYLIYRLSQPGSFCRGREPLPLAELHKNGIAYAVSANAEGHVQVYTFPMGALEALYARMPSSFADHARFGRSGRAVTLGSNPHLPPEAARWFKDYISKVREILAHAGVFMPSEPTAVKVFYALRGEYYFEHVVAKVSVGEGQVPLFFVGDSAGSTDYQLGLSGGRGLLAAERAVEAVLKQGEEAPRAFQQCWKKVIAREFNQPPEVINTPLMQFLYLTKGRAPYFTDRDFPAFERAFLAK